MKIVYKIILKHLACSYLVHTKLNENSNISFERYLEIYNYNIKNCVNAINDISLVAQKEMKKLQK